MLKTNPIITENEKSINYQFPITMSQSEITPERDEHELAAIKFVKKFGIRPHLLGYSFLIKAITLALETPHLLRSLKKELYPLIADHFGKDSRAIERNIRNAIESAYENDPERIRSIFYYKVDKPYVSEVLSVAVESIRYER